ncbi:MAG: Ser/Thr protein kinase, partial [Reinekea sp.]|nr:Ser/Thr protein kinase [Reinekea sp.]
QNAYTGANIEALLSEGTRSFVNHQRGVRFQGGTLIVSKIFDWYQTDFVASEGELTTFLAQFAEPKLRAQLKGYTGNIKYEYDWSLNEVRESQ